MDEGVDDDNSVVVLNPAKLEKLQLFRGDTILIKVREKRRVFSSFFMVSDDWADLGFVALFESEFFFFFPLRFVAIAFGCVIFLQNCGFSHCLIPFLIQCYGTPSCGKPKVGSSLHVLVI